MHERGRLTNKAEALTAAVYLTGTNTRRVKQALYALFVGAVSKDVVSRVWRKVKVDWDAWCARDLADEDIVRLTLDGTMIKTRLDREATNISVLAVIGVPRATGDSVAASCAGSGCPAKNADDQPAPLPAGGVRYCFRPGCRTRFRFAKRATQGQAPDLSPAALDTVIDLSEQLLGLHGRANWYGRKLAVAARSEPRIALLQTIPGIGPITASATVATVGSARQFACGRDFSAWLGLTPINRSTGGKERLGRISKMGDRSIRRLMVVGMTSRMKQIKCAPERFDPWFANLLGRKPAKLAVVAMANKTARIVWAVLWRNEPYRIRVN